MTNIICSFCKNPLHLLDNFNSHCAVCEVSLVLTSGSVEITSAFKSVKHNGKKYMVWWLWLGEPSPTLSIDEAESPWTVAIIEVPIGDITPTNLDQKLNLIFTFGL